MVAAAIGAVGDEVAAGFQAHVARAGVEVAGFDLGVLSRDRGVESSEPVEGSRRLHLARSGGFAACLVLRFGWRILGSGLSGRGGGVGGVVEV